MKKPQAIRISVSVLLLILMSQKVISQQMIDSASQRLLYDQEQQKRFLDSLTNLVSVARWRDSLKVTRWSNTLRSRIEERFSLANVSGYGDSLRSIGISESTVMQKTDSLVHRKATLLTEVADKQAGLQENVNTRYDAWADGFRRKFNLDSAGVRLPGPEVQGLSQSSSIKAPNNRLGANIQDIPAMPTLETTDFSSLGISPELKSVGGTITIPSTEQLGDWQESLPAIPDPGGLVNDQLGSIKSITKDPGATAEKAVSEMADLNEAAKTIKEADQLKTNNEMLKSAEQLKDPKASLADGKQQAINHFAGKEAVLQGAMSQMAKYKKKYSTLGSLSEIKKNDWLPRNGLKGKPFKERFRPGLNLGFRGGDTLLFDFYPNAAYRITGRIEAGLGAVYRVRVVQTPFGFDQRAPVWGMNTFVVVKTFKSVFLRFEVDGNSFPVSGSFERPSYRDWRWSFYSGIQTNFKLSKRLIGNAQMMYGFDKSLKDGFPERLQARVGVQYKLVKGKR